MFELEYISGAVLVLTEMIKRALKRRTPNIDPAVPIVIALVLGALLNLANAYLFAEAVTPALLKAAVREGLIAGGVAMGTWSAGKSYMQTQTVRKLSTPVR